MRKIKIHSILRYSLFVGVWMYISFSIYNKIQSFADVNDSALVEQIEFDAEESPKEGIDLEDELEVLTTKPTELLAVTNKESKYYKNIRQFPISSYLEHHTPPPKRSC